MVTQEDTVMHDAPASSSPPPSRPEHTTEEIDLDKEFPYRPKNTGPSPPFSDLYTYLFDPLLATRARPTGAARAGRRKTGPFPSKVPPNEARRQIIARFITRWNEMTGKDIFPAFRLIVPDKDRDRQVYGLKEKAIAKLLIKVVNIKGTQDAQGLLNWKLPLTGPGIVGDGKAGDFPGRVYDVIKRRPMRVDPGGMTVDRVNKLLDSLSKHSKSSDHLLVFNKFYRHMCAEEIAWVVRMILRQMKIGASEKTLFDVWHEDAAATFKVSSDLKRVCWDPFDTKARPKGRDIAITPMQCFQPQLALYQMQDFAKMAERVKPSKGDPAFWIEEKLDGERIQMHMISVPDDSKSGERGGNRFAFWSRNAKNYTYLYGKSFFDKNGSLTRHLKRVFNEKVRDIILDGEMITWDPVLRAMAPFGTLKTAALSEQKDPKYTLNQRPCYRIFDILYLNGMDLTGHSLRDRRNALNGAIANPIDGRIEIHQYQEARTGEEIETALRDVVARASEGLVIKNPFSVYSLNERTDDWLKVKPEYMTEYGEQLDVVIIGGYYGEGSRGGGFSSFLCGLRIDENRVRRGENAMKFISFFRVGGGFTVQDYKRIQKLTNGKWQKWDKQKPPNDYVELGRRDYQRPDEWIRAKDSVVIAVKAASVMENDKFAAGMSLRFPRFVSLREDKDWESALTKQEFLDLKSEVEKKKQMKIDKSRQKRKGRAKKKALVVLGRHDSVDTAYAGPKTECFKGLIFFIMGGSSQPVRKSKAELEQLVTTNGGEIVQTYDRRKIKEDKRRKVKEEGESSGLDDVVMQEEKEAAERAEDERLERLICIADTNLVQVNALKKKGGKSVIRPDWLFDMIRQGEIDSDKKRLYRLPFEPKHFLFAEGEDGEKAEDSVDLHGDSFARDIGIEDLRKLMDEMPAPKGNHQGLATWEALNSEAEDLPTLSRWILDGLVVAFVGNRDDDFDFLDSVAVKTYRARQYARYMGASVGESLEKGKTTHVVVCGRDERASRDMAGQVRREISSWIKLPRVLDYEWLDSCWKEGTRIDEERFPVI